MIEHADVRGGGAVEFHPASRAPAHIRAAINRIRSERGMSAVLSGGEIDDLLQKIETVKRQAAASAAGGTSVWIDPRSRLAPRNGTPSPTGYWPSAATPITRVLFIVSCGTAPARSTGRSRPERIVRGAFGLADELNASPGWMLRDEHQGPFLAIAGPRLRAVDTAAGLAIEWLPDISRPDQPDALRRIEAGAMASAGFVLAERMVSRGVDLVTRARLLHIAIVARAAYPGAVCRVYRDCPRGDAERRRQIAAVAAAAWNAADAATLADG